MKISMYSLNLKNILIISCLQIVSASVNAAYYTLPIGVLHYTPETSGNYLFPDVGGAMPHCSENIEFARSYNISGQISGRADLFYTAKIEEPAFVTLDNNNGKGGTIQIKISTLGLRKTASWNWVRDSHFVTGDVCSSQVNELNTYGEKSINRDSSVVSLGVHKGYDAETYNTLAFELLDAQSVQAGTYSARGGYQFTPSQIEMMYDVGNGTKVSPLIPNLTVVIPHTFNIDMPSPSVSLSPIYQNDETSTGEVRFNAQSNERYSITMTCSSPSAGTVNSDCYFADTLMELSAQVRFPVQSQTYELKNGKAVYIDGPQFTDTDQEYPGYIGLTLNGIDKYGEAGRTYVDTINMTFEADF